MSIHHPFVVLVTGSSGFIGSNIVKRLFNYNCRVIGIDIKPATLTNSAYTHFQLDLVYHGGDTLFRLIGEVDFIIHLAARTDLDGLRLNDYDVNTKGVKNVCDLALLMKSARVSFASTQLVNSLGDNPSSVYDYSPDCHYGLSKVIGEYIIRSTLSSSSVSYVVFRPTTVWGPGMSSHYQSFFRLLMARKYFHCVKQSLKSFSYIENCVSQILAFTFRDDLFPSSSLSYICDSPPLDVVRWSNDLAVALGVKPPLRLPFVICILIAFLNRFLSNMVRRSKPFIPLTPRRLRNISTSYVYESLVYESLYCVKPVSYSEGVRCTAKWFLGL